MKRCKAITENGAHAGERCRKKAGASGLCYGHNPKNKAKQSASMKRAWTTRTGKPVRKYARRIAAFPAPIAPEAEKQAALGEAAVGLAGSLEKVIEVMIRKALKEVVSSL